MSGPVSEAGVPLAGLTTIRVGGPAERLVTARATDDLVDAVRAVDEAREPLLVLSGGSNLLVADAGVPGTVLRVATSGVTVEDVDADDVLVKAAAGEDWDGFVARAVTEGWSGIEALSGIPGLVGATPIQNVGAYGQEVAQTIARVRTWDRQERRPRAFANAECAFAYRNSIFKATAPGGDPRFVVLDVTFRLARADVSAPIAYADLARELGVAAGARVPLPDAREAVLRQRRQRGMVLDPADPDTWSCGSFFTNPILCPDDFDALRWRVTDRLGPGVTPPGFPTAEGTVKTSAAWLIDRAGFTKGHGSAPARLSTKHTLALTNRGGARAADVIALAREIRDGVSEAFGVGLVNEPVLVGLRL